MEDDQNPEHLDGGAGRTHTMADRLASAGVTDLADPMTAWLQLREVEGNRATIIDLYELAAAPRGLAAHELPAPERYALAQQAVPQIWAGFTVTAGSERPGVSLVVADYDPTWPRMYELWHARIDDALGTAALNIEHVGSTSVPGLPAKPIVDIQVSVADLADEPRYVAQLESAGVQLRSRDELHRYFRPPRDQPRDVHVHVCTAGGEWEHDHLLFRDYLRSHPDARQRYAEAKRANSRIWADDSWAYTEAKTGVILDIMAEAESWSRTTGWATPGR
jgi:GrpB-like predicted nucleotidyltransferase (UPF0157 family)